MEEEKRSSVTEPSLSDSGRVSGDGNVSAQAAGRKNDSVKPGEVEPRRSRLKVFNKVMEKSLQRLVADARLVH